MTLEEKIRIIEEKIANLPQEFDVEENHIIINNPRLIDLIVQTIFDNLHLCNEEVFGCLNNTILNALLERDSNTIYFHFVDNMLNEKIVSTEELRDFLNQVTLTPEQTKYLEEKVKNAYLNKDISIEKFSHTEQTIKEMLKYGRFDLISKIEKVYLEPEFLEELWNVYPFEEYPFPKFFSTTNALCKKHLKDFPVEDAVLMYLRVLLECFYGDQTERLEATKMLPDILPILNEKLSKVESLDFSCIYGEFNFFRDLVPNGPFNQAATDQIVKDMHEVAVKLFKLGLYEIMDEVFRNNLITNDDVRNILIDLAQSGNHKMMQEIGFVHMSDKFKDDIELATIFLENGFVQDAGFISFDFVHGKTEYIIEQLNNKNEKFKNYATNLVYDGKGFDEKQFDLYLAMLNSGFVENISTGSFNHFTEEEIEQLKYIINKYPKIAFNANAMDDKDFLKILPDLQATQRSNTIIDFLKASYYPENIDTFIEVNKNKFISNIIKNDFTKGLDLLKEEVRSIIEIPELLDEYCKNDVYINRLLDFVNHDENLTAFYNEENYNRVKNYLCKEYKISLESLDRFQGIVGPLIIRYIENENIQELLKLSIEDQNKVLALFPKDTYTMQDLRGAYDSLKQYEFSKKYPNEVQVFPTLLHAIEDKNDEVVEELITKIAKELDETFVKRFLKKYDLPSEYTNGDMTNLVLLVVEKIKISTGDKLDKYQTILHEMTDYYISKKREEYRTSYDMEAELDIPYEFEEKSFDRVVVKYIIMDSLNIKTRMEKPKPKPKSNTTQPAHPDEWLWDTDWDWDTDYYVPEYYTLYEFLIYKLEGSGIDSELAKETIDYYITKDQTVCRDLKLVQKTIPKLLSITKELVDEVPNLHYLNDYGFSQSRIEGYVNQADEKGEIKRIYKIEDTRSLFEILTQLNIPALQKGVLSNQEVYESLLTTMKKRKIHLIPSCLSNILGTEYINISGDLSNIAGFMSYYGAIHKNAKSNLEATGKSSDNILLNITNILINAEVYSGMSSVYSQILGSDDAKLIKANPKPNEASRKLANEGRLKEAVERTKKLFERQEITIPPFEETVQLEGNKSMYISVGNFTNPTNLTHGERTGACMRIGGVGETLFEFALDNPNGFHIRFEDPNTHEYISRVTGFRNGNTVFLNELRESCNQKKYNNTDVVEACKKAAEMLIQLSKNSPCPIENVVIHKEYATLAMDDPMENLGVDNIKEGLPHFYTDVGRSAIILATSAKQDKFVPLNFDKTNVPTYQPLREKPRVAKTIHEASNKINRVNSVKRLLAGENYEYIEPYQFSNGLIYAILSNDWYIYVDEKGNIMKDFIDIDPRAKEELAAALIEVEKNLAQIKSENQEAKYGL